VKLGLDVDWKDGRTLHIKKVLAGVVFEHNRGKEKVVHGGDRIIAINGHFDDPKAMLNECKTQRKLQLLIRTTRDLTSKASEKPPKPPPSAPEPFPEQPPKPPSSAAAGAKAGRATRAAPRPFEFMATLDMTGQSMLGVEVDWADGRTLYVKSVHGGAVQLWNQTRPPEFFVQPGARILAVNGYSDNPETMASLCRELIAAQMTVQLRVRGPPLPPVALSGEGEGKEKEKDKGSDEPEPKKEKKDKDDKERKKEKKKEKKER